MAAESEESVYTPARLQVLKRKLIKTLKLLLKSFIGWLIFTILGILLFVYLEECLRAHPKPLSSLQKAWSKTCQLVMGNNTASETQNGTLLTMDIIKLCKDEAWQFPDDRRCVYDQKNLIKYYDYLCTVAFTIGYGHTVPLSDLGKIMTMIYALPAIGLTIFLYSYMAEVILIGTQMLAALFEKRVLQRKKVYFCNFKLCMIQIALAVIFYCLMAILVWLEQQPIGILDAFYFTFISLTTIGFGDIYFDTGKLVDRWSTLPLFLVFLVAIGTVASTISAVNDLLKSNVKKKRWLSSRKRSKKTASVDTKC